MQAVHSVDSCPQQSTGCVLLLLLLLLQPTHGYVMPGYRRGSVAKLLTDICNR